MKKNKKEVLKIKSLGGHTFQKEKYVSYGSETNGLCVEMDCCGDKKFCGGMLITRKDCKKLKNMIEELLSLPKG